MAAWDLFFSKSSFADDDCWSLKDKAFIIFIEIKYGVFMGQVLAKVQQQHTNLFRAADAACVCCCDRPDRCDEGPALPWAALRAAIRA